ncbi:MAG TPA: DUF1772 domain-containing protein [Stellaceae bacterium]|jgi:hypothetical protein|nr:DUF1772 domain-containing protein [Stellaceae bacterium]
MIVALALVIASFYSGAALYVNLVEKPALLALDDKAALIGWKIALKRGAVIQAPLCAIGFALGMIAWLHLRDIGNAVAALAMLANIPWTVALILPINRQLQAIAPEAAGEASRALMLRWYSRHKLRSALGVIALVFFLLALLAL